MYVPKSHKNDLFQVKKEIMKKNLSLSRQNQAQL